MARGLRLVYRDFHVEGGGAAGDLGKPILLQPTMPQRLPLMRVPSGKPSLASYAHEGRFGREAGAGLHQGQRRVGDAGSPARPVSW